MTQTKQQKQERWEEIINIMKSLSLKESLSQNYHERSTYANDVERIVKIIQDAFTDEMLYLNRSLRKSLDHSVSQWVSIDEVLDNKELKKLFQTIELYHTTDRKTIKKLIRIELVSRKSSLVCNRVALKRERPFVNHLKDTKPIYIQNFIMENKMQNIFEYLRSITIIYKIDFHLCPGWALVYAEKPDEILTDVAYRKQRVLQIENQEEKDSEDDESMKQLRAYSYQEYCLFSESKNQKNWNQIIESILVPFHIQYFKSKLRQLQEEMQNQDERYSILTTNIFKDSDQQLRQIEDSVEMKMRRMRKENHSGMRKPKNTSEHFFIRLKQKIALINENFNNFMMPNFEFNAKHLNGVFQVREQEKQERMRKEQEQQIQAQLGEQLKWIENYNAKRSENLREIEI